jgi:hypothetical protein
MISESTTRFNDVNIKCSDSSTVEETTTNQDPIEIKQELQHMSKEKWFVDIDVLTM